MTKIGPRFFSLTLLLTVVSPAAGQPDTPNFPDGEVTIPYTELKDLLQALEKAGIEKPAPKPPLPAALTGARYRLDFAGISPQLTADFEVRGFEEGWHSVPLFGGTPQLESVDTGDAAQVARENGGYALLFEGAGSFSARLASSLPPAGEWETGREIEFVPAPATLGELRVTGVPDGFRFQIEGWAPSRTEADGALVFHLPADGTRWQFRLEETSGDERDTVPGRWTLNLEVLAEFAEGRLLHRARVQARAETGSSALMTLEFPSEASVTEVEGDDLVRWKRLPRRQDSRSIEIQWGNRDLPARTFLISWEIPQSSLAETWTIVLPRAVDADAEEEPTVPRALVALAPPDGLELGHPSFRRQAESRQLPEWLRQTLKERDAVIGEITSADPVELTATWLPRLETAQATISKAEFETRLATDGSLLVDATYWVQHRSPIDWTLSLPAMDQILVCEVNEKSVQPIRRADGAIEFRLPSSTEKTGKEPLPGSAVRLSYAQQAEAFDPVAGRTAMDLPQTDLFVHRLDWSLAIPARYEFTAVEGNVEIADTPAGEPESEGQNVIRLFKELCREERPAVEFFYRRRDLDAGS